MGLRDTLILKKSYLFLSVLLIVAAALGINLVINSDSWTPKSSPNVFLITIEATPSYHLPCYGYKRYTAPNICGIAEDGVLFEKAHSQGSATYVSLPSMLTSSIPSHVSLQGWNKAFSSDAKTILDVFEDRGYNINTKLPSQIIEAGISESKYNYGGEDINELTLEKEPVFFWSHEEDTHFPYSPEEEYRIWENLSYSKNQLISLKWPIKDNGLPYRLENLSLNLSKRDLLNLYDESLLSLDSELGKFIEGLKEKGIYNDSLIIITADHGETFGSYKYLNYTTSGEKYNGKIVYGHGHGSFPRKDQIHVPLIIKFPENNWAGRRVKQDVRHIDIVPTVYDQLNIENTHEVFGKSLIPAIKGKNLNLTLFTASDKPDNCWSLRNQNYTYFLGNMKDECARKSARGILFERGEDLQNRNRIEEPNEGILDQMKNRLCSIFQEGLEKRESFEKANLTEKTKQRLKDLGYLN